MAPAVSGLGETFDRAASIGLEGGAVNRLSTSPEN